VDGEDGAVRARQQRPAIVKGNTIITRHLGTEILHGITRAAVLIRPQAQMEVERAFAIKRKLRMRRSSPLPRPS
jgi:D-alanine transaminase